jgi:hypothetical protein
LTEAIQIGRLRRLGDFGHIDRLVATPVPLP